MKKRGRANVSQKLNNVLYFLSGVMSVVIVIILVIGVQTKAQNTQPSDYPDTDGQPVEETAQETTAVEKWQEGTIVYGDRYYRYNSRLKTYLFMGIDTNEAVYNMDTKDTGYQSDAIFLIVADSMNQKLSVITINRNTMTEIERFTGNGVSMGKANSQICVQHAYGDGKKLSCTRVETAIANLFYNIPIHGYFSMNMGAIPGMNDAVGGVTVDVMDDLDYADKGVSLKAGETVNLNGAEAYCYLRGRDINDFDSATERLRRQEQYISAFLAKLKQCDDRKTALTEVYSAISDYTVTDVDFTKLMDTLLNFDYSEDDMYTVPGESQVGSDGHEEFYVDEEAFYDLIIRIFYEEVDAR
ncbi:MAG: LCP family protein [Agathobacter sp.]|nr:LCP family protein [Agathobacter sp.]